MVDWLELLFSFFKSIVGYEPEAPLAQANFTSSTSIKLISFHALCSSAVFKERRSVDEGKLKKEMELMEEKFVFEWDGVKTYNQSFRNLKRFIFSMEEAAH